MIIKFRNKGMLIAAAAAILMCGCGDGKAGNDGDAETLNAIENISVQEEVSQEENMPDQEEDEAQGDVPAQENISTENGQETEEGETAPEDSIVWDDPTGEGIQTIHGSIRKLEAGSFAIEQAMTGTLEDGGGDIMVMASTGYEGEDALVTVKYSDDTEFIVSTTTDGGITSTKREGSSGELEMDSLLEITGSWEGEIFLADKISIFISK